MGSVVRQGSVCGQRHHTESGRSPSKAPDKPVRALWITDAGKPFFNQAAGCC